MKIIPFRKNLLVKKLKKESKMGGIYLPDRHIGRFMIYEILAIGEDVKLDLHEGDLVIADPLDEPIENTDQSFILEERIHGRILDES